MPRCKYFIQKISINWYIKYLKEFVKISKDVLCSDFGYFAVCISVILFRCLFQFNLISHVILFVLTEKQIDYETLQLFNEYPEAIASLVSNVGDQLKLRKGLKSVLEVCIKRFHDGKSVSNKQLR